MLGRALPRPGAPTEIGTPLTGFGSWVNGVAFSPDGRILAGGSSDNTVKFWDVEGWKPRSTFLTNPAPVTAVKFLPGRDQLINVATDGAARLWPLPGPVIDGPKDTIWALGYSADGRRLMVAPGRADPAIELWDASDRQHPNLLGQVSLPAGIGAPTGAGSISANGRLLAAGTSTGKVQLWDIADPSKPIPSGPPLSQSSALVEQVAFSPDNHLLAAGGDDHSVVIWDVTNPGHPDALTRLTEPTNLVLGMAFSANSRMFSTASADNTVQRWGLDTPNHPTFFATLTGFDNYAYAVAFSLDRRVLATGSADKTVRLWSIADPRHPRSLGAPITGPGNYVYSLALDPTGRTLAAAVTDGTVWQWDISDPAHPRHLATLTAVAGQAFRPSLEHRPGTGGQQHLHVDGRSDHSEGMGLLGRLLIHQVTGVRS